MPMPDFTWKDLSGTKVAACNTCPEEPSEPGVPNHRHIKGQLDCHSTHLIGPQPTGVPRKAPCPDGASPDASVHQLMCTHCQDGVWHPAPPPE
ncbi:MAG: hypothetical protein JSU73_13095 [candidate division WOR-3 bacterium]|nr:MAG: hypothetical protein JSU73_13095 [candidate division WOR-3 bacterium]